MGAADFVVGPTCATASTASPSARQNDGNVGVADPSALSTFATTSTLPLDAREHTIPMPVGGVDVPDLCLASSSARTPTRSTAWDPEDGESMVVGASDRVFVSTFAKAPTPVQDALRQMEMGVLRRKGADTRLGWERGWGEGNACTVRARRAPIPRKCTKVVRLAVARPHARHMSLVIPHAWE